ncbi:UNVERIFIED_ORG: hypothetical protein E4P37_16785 [Bacillus sp. AZ43]
MTTTTASPRSLRSGGLLRPALLLDAVVTGANGAAYLLAAPLLDDVLGLSTGLLRGVGAFLVVFAGAVWLTARTRPLNVPAVEAVIGANALWVIGSAAAVVTGFGSPTTLGAVWLVLQAVVVAAFAALQLAGLRRR